MPINNKYLIYGLVDPMTKQLRYVGKSSYGVKRARSHAYRGYLSRDRSYCGNWIRQLHANLTNGGEGAPGRIVSQITREKLRQINVGNKNSAGKKRALTPEQRLAFAERARLRSADPSIRAKISATLKGKRQSLEQVTRRVESIKSRWAVTPRKQCSEETKLKMSASAKRRWIKNKDKE